MERTVYVLLRPLCPSIFLCGYRASEKIRTIEIILKVSSCVCVCVCIMCERDKSKLIHLVMNLLMKFGEILLEG